MSFAPPASLSASADGPAVSQTSSQSVTSRLFWPGLLLALATTSITIGIIWDISWHISIGRDTFWTPAHLAIHFGGVLGGCVGGWLAFRHTFLAGPHERDSSVGILGARAPLGAWVAMWGAVAMITSAPFDNWWHNAYGLDVRIISPPHTLLGLGMLGISLGALLLGLAHQNRANDAAGNALFIYIGGIFLTLGSVFVLEFSTPNLQHTATFYEVCAGTFAIRLVALSVAGRISWPATKAAAVYLLLQGLMTWVLPLFPATPKLAPIFHPITHMVPPAFPLLLIFPAFAIDLLLRRTGLEWSGWRRLALAFAVAASFVAVFFVCQWFFSEFMLTPAADNWFFAGNRYWGYTTNPHRIAAKFWHVTAGERNYNPVNGSVVLWTWALAAAGAWIGLIWWLDEESPAMTSLIRVGARRPSVTRSVIVTFFLVLALLGPWTARAGSPDVFFDGKIGPYPAQITIRMPSVVPGQAQIEVRPKTDKPLTVSFLPLYSKTSVKNAPPPEIAQPTASEPGLYQGALWLMSVGAYSIEVRLSGPLGEGETRIPVNSVATSQLPLSPFLADLLLGLGALLFVGMVGIVYAAAGESVLAPGAPMRKPERTRGLVAGAIAAIVLMLLLVGGWNWWKADEREFRRSLREGAWPDLTSEVEVEGRQRILHLTLGEKAFKPNYSLPLLLDHGKLLHLFLIRKPAHDVFAHLHPVRRGGKAFDLALPDLPEGNYQIFCDLTLSDSGLSSTASGSVHLPPQTNAAAAPAGKSYLQPDPDDSWSTPSADSVAPAAPGETSYTLPGGRLAVWKAHPPLRAKQNAHLEFSFRDSTGQPLPLEPYMGMMSHAAILRADDKIFAHLHPTGNFSMAAESFFTAKIAREVSPNPDAEPPMEMDHSKMHHGSPGGAASSSIILPYEFPLPGDYRVWVQVKTGGQVLTATFGAAVAP